MTPGPIGVGTAFEQRRSFLGRIVDERFEITALEPGTHVAIETTSGPLPFAFDYRVTPTADGSTLLVTQVRLKLPGMLAHVEALLAP